MKLKDLLNAGYDVKMGQVFTMKDCPPFKTPKQIAEEERLTEGPSGMGVWGKTTKDNIKWNIGGKGGFLEIQSPHGDSIEIGQEDAVLLAKFIMQNHKKIASYEDITGEPLKEVTYREFKTDETQTPRQKVGNAIKEMNSLLFRMEQIIRQSAKLKNELDMSPEQYWGSTQQKLERVTARVLKVAKHLKELKKESDPAPVQSVNENQKLLDKIGDKLADMEMKGKENTPEYKALEKKWQALYKKIG